MDFTLRNEFSIFLLRPVTPAAKAFAKKAFPSAQSSDGSVAVEPRLAWDTVERLKDQGWTVE